MKEKILELIQQTHEKYKNAEEISDALGLDGAVQKEALLNALRELESEHKIIKNKKGNYVTLKEANLYVGNIQIKNKGFGFVTSSELPLDVYVAKEDTKGAFNGDTVLVKVQPKVKQDAKDSAKVIEIIKRNLDVVVGEVILHKEQYYLKNDDPIADVVFAINALNGAIVEHKVQAKVVEFQSDKKILVDVIKIIGHKNDVGVDIASVAAKYNFPTEFREETLAEVAQIDANIKQESSSRRDLSNHLVITIDGADAKDLDDAIRVEKLGNGNTLLGVYIADVAHYVRARQPLDQEALLRGTSVYLADRVIPMLPHRLSNDLCSLNPNEKKLVMACEMEINHEGEVVSKDIFEAVITSRYRMTYTEVEEILKGKQHKDIELQKAIMQMQKLSKTLNRMRTKRGALDFDVRESKLEVNAQGMVTDVYYRKRLESEKIIEEFMLIANETVAETIFWLELPFIYRVHEDPKEEKLKKFLTISKNLGYPIQSKGKKVTPKALQELLGRIKEEDKGLNVLLVRMMAKARYSEKNLGHYGLASSCYTHFTSPIRRYPDLLVHRLLKKYIIKQEVDAEDFEGLYQVIIQAAEQSSRTERSAMDCENEVNDMKKAEYMENFIGSVFNGVVSSITNFGMFVALDNSVEGLVHVLDMDDDYYEYYEDMMVLVGARKKKQYRMGDRVRVRLISASKEQREISFKLLQSTPRKNAEKPKGRDKHENRRKKNNRKKQKSKS